MRIEYHRSLIADQVRIGQYYKALERVIRKGESIVVDIGTGTGLLAFLAAKLGAKKVYAYEAAEIGAVAEQLKKLNRLRNVELIPGRSTDIIDPPRGDVVVTETLGNFALEEFLVQTMNDARARHLKPGGALIPAGVAQWAAPVVSPRLRDELIAWDRIGYGLDFTPARAMSLNNVYIRRIEAREMLDGGRAAACWDKLDFAVANRQTRKGELAWTMSRPATVHGLAVWWTAQLAEGIELTTSPLAAPTHWEQLFFPALEPLQVAAGETLACEIHTKSAYDEGTDIAWSFCVRPGKGRERSRQALSLAKGFIP
jgi:protein arginine N-methyltransferase 1